MKWRSASPAGDSPRGSPGTANLTHSSAPAAARPRDGFPPAIERREHPHVSGSSARRGFDRELVWSVCASAVSDINRSRLAAAIQGWCASPRWRTTLTLSISEASISAPRISISSCARNRYASPSTEYGQCGAEPQAPVDTLEQAVGMAAGARQRYCRAADRSALAEARGRHREESLRRACGTFAGSRAAKSGSLARVQD